MRPVSKKGKFYICHITDGNLRKGGGSLRKASGSLSEKNPSKLILIMREAEDKKDNEKLSELIWPLN